MLTPSVLLMVLVIAAAGIAGISHFNGPRWYPHLGGGQQTLRTPLAKLGNQPKRERSFARPSGGLPGWLLIVALAMVGLAVAALVLRWWRLRRAPGKPTVPTMPVQMAPRITVAPEPEPETLLTGIELALQALDEPREPADAVVRAWLGLQETAEESGIVRGPSETPTEFTSRILRSAFADDRAIHTLLRLYLRTRFGDHPVASGDVTVVRAALEKLVSSWRASQRAPAGSPLT